MIALGQGEHRKEGVLIRALVIQAVETKTYKKHKGPAAGQNSEEGPVNLRAISETSESVSDRSVLVLLR